jgi:hypothetical protein
LFNPLKTHGRDARTTSHAALCFRHFGDFVTLLVAREEWGVDWKKVNTPLGLPGQRQGLCVRTSFVPLREGLPTKEAEYRFFATDLSPHRASLGRLRDLVREHRGIENRLHHAKDRTWLEDRHWVGNKRTGTVVTMLRSVACGILRKARFKGLSPRAFCPERIEFLSRRPWKAVALVSGAARL